MRLLQLRDTGDISLTDDLTGNDVPRYGILSHTWGKASEEVSFKDMVDGTAKSRAGYEKIRFCGQQASRDGLEYFWVDTCCIDKSSNAELSEAINSMFRWYRDAAKCYVYLPDVSRRTLDSDGQLDQFHWERSFRRSRWFTRGWTLQELIAPASVEFFSGDGSRLGTKKSLEWEIKEVTGIPINALRGHQLSEYSVSERMAWARNRHTARQEDVAYSLLGIFNVYMPLIYGEGTHNAFKRLRASIDDALRGTKREDFSVTFSVFDVVETEYFVARHLELAEIHENLRGDGSRRIVVLHGLGGIGKTQLSIAYAKRYRENYSAVFWLNAKDENTLKQSFVKVAKHILREHRFASGLSIKDTKENVEETVDVVKSWLSLQNNTRWLMVFDNYDNPVTKNNKDPAAIDIRAFLPESHQGSVIITTRSSQVKIGHRIHVKKLDNMLDSLEILAKTSGREGLSTDPNAMKLAKLLDGLPLALATAGAYLDQTAISCADYVRLYEASWMKLQKTSPELISYENRMLYSTWHLSFNHVRQQNELSAKLLCFWAYLSNEDVWFELLQHANGGDPKWIRDLTEDELCFNQAVRVLSEHGFVEATLHLRELPESGGYSMHGCVHSWTIHALNQNWDYCLGRLALRLIASHIPKAQDASWWLTQQRLLHHATECSRYMLKTEVTDNEIAWALTQIGNLYRDQDKLHDAEIVYQHALQGHRKCLDPNDFATLNTVNSLGSLYYVQGKLDDAEIMYKRALQGHQKTLDPNHIPTLDTINNLGNLYYSQDKLDKAEKMYLQALHGKESTLGSAHPSTLETVNNLGNLYRYQDKLGDAEKMYQRAMQGYEKVLGPNHTSTLDTVNNLGVVYKAQGKLDDAERMYQRALHGIEEALGPTHTSTLNSVNNLGLVYYAKGKLGDSEKMYQRTLEGREKALGPNHTSTLETVNNLGVLYENQGKLKDAEKMYHRALQGLEKALGPNHTSTLKTVNNLGILYKVQNKLADAEKLFQRALQGLEKTLGSNHSSTLNTVDNLGILYKIQGRLDDAERMYQWALQGYEKILGPCHNSTLNAANNLGILYKVRGEPKDAEKMYLRVLQGKETILGTTHPSTLETINNLGVVYKIQGKLNDAERMYHRALQGIEGILGPTHTFTLNTVENLGILYYSQGRLDESEKMYQRALRGKETTLGLAHLSTLETINNLGVLYESQGKFTEAEKMYLRALRGMKTTPAANHTSIFNTANQLGLVYYALGKLDDAEKVFQWTLRRRQKALGRNHISTLNTINNLGVVYRVQGNLNSAEEMYQLALQGLEKALGSNHTDTLNTVNNLGVLYYAQGKIDEAKRMYQRALEGREKSLGSNHTSTVSTANNLSLLYTAQRKLDDAANNT